MEYKMKQVPSYTKVIAIGSSFTEEALTGDVILQEKVDGSQFDFGLNEDGIVVCRSHNAQMDVESLSNNMFQCGTDYLNSIQEVIKTFEPDTYFYAEFLQKPKHNTLKYGRIPKNNIVIFDAMIKGRWATREELTVFAKKMDIDLIPELYRGKADIEKVKELLTTPSYLGEEIIEGVVIKNYNQTIMLGGHIFPLFTKYVREAFKERHAADWKVRQPKGALQEFVDGFKTEARWNKAIIHAKEQNLLVQSPKDIGVLIPAIQNDIKEEETENIKNHLYKCFIEDILRSSVKGFPEYYKNLLLENVKSESSQTEVTNESL